MSAATTTTRDNKSFLSGQESEQDSNVGQSAETSISFLSSDTERDNAIIAQMQEQIRNAQQMAQDAKEDAARANQVAACSCEIAGDAFSLASKVETEVVSLASKVETEVEEMTRNFSTLEQRLEEQSIKIDNTTKKLFRMAREIENMKKGLREIELKLMRQRNQLNKHEENFANQNERIDMILGLVKAHEERISIFQLAAEQQAVLEEEFSQLQPLITQAGLKHEVLQDEIRPAIVGIRTTLTGLEASIESQNEVIRRLEESTDNKIDMALKESTDVTDRTIKGITAQAKMHAQGLEELSKFVESLKNKLERGKEANEGDVEGQAITDEDITRASGLSYSTNEIKKANKWMPIKGDNGKDGKKRHLLKKVRCYVLLLERVLLWLTVVFPLVHSNHTWHIAQSNKERQKEF